MKQCPSTQSTRNVPERPRRLGEGQPQRAPCRCCRRRTWRQQHCAGKNTHNTHNTHASSRTNVRNGSPELTGARWRCPCQRPCPARWWSQCRTSCRHRQRLHKRTNTQTRHATTNNVHTIVNVQGTARGPAGAGAAMALQQETRKQNTGHEAGRGTCGRVSLGHARRRAGGCGCGRRAGGRGAAHATACTYIHRESSGREAERQTQGRGGR